VTEAPTPIEISWRDHLFHLRMALSSARFIPRLPSALLGQLFPGIDALTISMRHEVRERALLYAEAYVLSLITAFKRPRRIFEIGTATGQSTLLMARQAPDAVIDTLDLGSALPALGVQTDEPPWSDVESIGAAYRTTEHEARITQHLGDSATFDYEPLAGVVDLVFVDGAHTYEYVRSDSKNALRMLAPGGVIVWDDCNYQNPGVSKALRELHSAGTEVYRVHGARFAVHRSRDTQ
jgi:predicted O-methyltransferase YrrM